MLMLPVAAGPAPFASTCRSRNTATGQSCSKVQCCSSVPPNLALWCQMKLQHACWRWLYAERAHRLLKASGLDATLSKLRVPASGRDARGARASAAGPLAPWATGPPSNVLVWVCLDGNSSLQATCCGQHHPTGGWCRGWGNRCTHSCSSCAGKGKLAAQAQQAGCKCKQEKDQERLPGEVEGR